MSMVQIYQFGSVLLLTALLFFPISKLIWVLSVRRLQRKQEHPLSQQEIHAQQKRARIIGFFVALAFSYFFHLNVLQTIP